MTKGNIPSPPSSIPKPPDISKKDYRKPQNIIGLNNEGRIPPNAIDLEEVVLGALLIDKRAIVDIANFMKPEFFYKDSHKIIFKSIIKLYDSGSPIDLLIVIEELRKINELVYIGGEPYLINLCNKVSSAAHIDFHCRIIIQKYVLRELIKTSTEVKEASYHSDPDIFSLMDKVSNDIDKIYRSAVIKDNSSDSSDAKAELKAKRDKALKGESVGYKVGISEFDNWCGGFLPRELITIAARPGMGKCLGKGTKIIMFDGSIKKVEDIIIGDKIMGPDSKPRKILSLTRGREQMYWIKQNQGIDYRVNESHILSLKRSRILKDGTKPILNISVKDYISKSNKFKSNYKGYKVNVDFKEKTTTIEPYYLGIWLGDGNQEGTIISTEDKEVVEYLNSYSKRLKMQFVQKKYKNKMAKSIIQDTRVHQMNTLKGLLNFENLLYNKHIPDDYLINSRKNRLELLAGLIDSDGHYQKDANCFEITQKRENLAIQIKYLCDTLGFKTSLVKKKATLKSRNYSCDVFRVRISGNIDEIPTKIKRKKARKSLLRKDFRVNGITVEKDIIDDYYGFEIDGDKLFLLEDCTVTHNTSIGLAMMCNSSLDFGIPTAFLSLEMSQIDVKNRIAARLTGISYSKIRMANLTDEEYLAVLEAFDYIDKSNLSVHDILEHGNKLLRIIKLIRKLVANGVRVIYIDYVQLIKLDKTTSDRTGELNTITRELKALSNELNIPIIEFAQLNRSVDSRPGHVPTLADLKQSGSIEEDSDTVIFIVRDAYYQQSENSGIEIPPHIAGETRFIVAKGRSIGTRSFKVMIDFLRYTVSS